MTKIKNDVKNIAAWWYKHDPLNIHKYDKMTLTWKLPENFHRFADASGRGSYVPATGATWEPGDLMGIAFKKGGPIDHMLIITGTDPYGWPVICCHSDDRLDVSILDELFPKYENADWYVYHM